MEVRGITLERSLKWVGGITAVLSLIFGLRQITQIVSDVRERQRQVAELSKIAKLQQGAADYESAWASFEQASKTAESGGQLAKLTGQLSEERRELRQAQEDLAMEWLENARPSRGQTFSDVVDKLVPVLNRGIANASGARKGDLLAHFGWANFLRSRDGRQDLNPEQQYREALEIDPMNPYAHAHWGHWNLWRSEKKIEEARRHFSTAIASGRARGYVRKIQFAAWKNLRGEGDGEFLKAVNDMRKNNEKIEPQSRNDLYSIYTFACSSRYDADNFAKLVASVPATEQLATFRALFYGEDFNESRRAGRDACLATLLEAAGQKEEALQTWLTLRQKFPRKDAGGLSARVHEAITRLSPGR
jgi:TolA-binding protein